MPTNEMPQIVADARWTGPHGIGRFASEVLRRLPTVKPLPTTRNHLGPLDPIATSWQLRKLKAAVYFSPGFNPPVCCPMPLVFAIHDLIHLHCPAESSAAKRAYYRWIVRPAARKAHAVLTVSEHSKRAIVDWAGLDENRVVVVGNGVGTPFDADDRRQAPGYPYLLHVGAHKPHKNLGRLFEAFAASGLWPDVRLVLTGSPRRATQGCLRQLGIAQSVVFIDTVGDDELAAWYRGALALVLVSLHDGFGLPALEAMACGTAVVAARSSALPEVVGNAALMVDPCDVTAIAEALKTIARDNDLRRELCQRGLRRAEMFTWDRTAEAVSRVLTEAAR